jgi:hypothetical protein
MARNRTSTQRDLFEKPATTVPLTPAARAKALEQLQALLIEAMASVSSQRETGDDEDHV